jgi:hypothetical protein
LSEADAGCGQSDSGGIAGAIRRIGAGGPVTTSKSPRELGRDIADLLYLEAARLGDNRDRKCRNTKAASGGRLRVTDAYAQA